MYVNYKELKEKVTLLQLLKRHEISTTKKGSQLVATCPLCKQEAFKVSVEKTVYSAGKRQHAVPAIPRRLNPGAVAAQA